MELENEKVNQVSDVYAKYGIASSEDVDSICKFNNIDIKDTLMAIKEDVSQEAIDAFSLGVAIAFKKNSKLASYVAYDIGEGLEGYCLPDLEASEARAGFNLGHKVATILKKEEDTSEMDFGALFHNIKMSSEQIIEATKVLSQKVEEAINEEE